MLEGGTMKTGGRGAIVPKARVDGGESGDGGRVTELPGHR
jgi:hypothetical protein